MSVIGTSVIIVLGNSTMEVAVVVIAVVTAVTGPRRPTEAIVVTAAVADQPVPANIWG